jgi:hypothetical protein
MAQLDIVLTELETIVGELKQASQLPDDARRKLVVSNRQRLADKLRALVAASAADPRLKSDPQLAAEFDRRMTTWRHDMAQFQAQWRVADADVSSAHYAQGVAALRQSNSEFLGWARAALRG